MGAVEDNCLPTLCFNKGNESTNEPLWAAVNITLSLNIQQREQAWFMCNHRSVSHLWTGEGNAADDARSGESSLGKDQSCSWIISAKQ